MRQNIVRRNTVRRCACATMGPLPMSSTNASVPAVPGDIAASPLQPYRSAGDGRRWWNLPSQTVARRLAISGACVLSLGVVLAFCESRWGATITSWDRPINAWFVRLGGGEGSIVHTLSAAVSWIGSGRRTGPIVLVFAAVLVALRNWRWAVFVLLSAEVGYLISDVTKVLVARQRPPYLTFDSLAVTTSFPSGHTFGGVTAWVAMGLTLWFLLPRPWSTVFGVTLMSIGLLNGPSRLLLGAHWVSDVIGSWLLASGWCLLAASFTLWRWGPRPDDVEPA